MMGRGARHFRAGDGERGAALITVLVMLALMSALAVVVVEAANIGARRSANQAQMAQARWYLRGAESFAVGRLDELVQRSIEAPLDASEWLGVPFEFPLDNGLMRVTLWDGGNCFNLNSVVERDGDNPLQASGRGQLQLARLLDLTEMRDVDSRVVQALVDWIDQDLRVLPGGAEDESYARPEAPYVTANNLLADISELRKVRGFTPEIVARLSQYACVRPTEFPNLINPNTLTPAQAPLLSMVVGSDLSLISAQEIIQSRPRGGWADLDEFFLSSRFSGVELSEPIRAQFTLRSQYYVMGAQVVHGDVTENSAALIEYRGQARVIRRVYGAGAQEPIL